jgi:hypothetical protein
MALQGHQTPKTLVVYHGLSWFMVYHCCPTSSSRFGHSNHLSSKRQAPSFSLIPPADLLAVRLQIRRSPNALRNSGTASASSVARKIQGDPEDQCRISFPSKLRGFPASFDNRVIEELLWKMNDNSPFTWRVDLYYMYLPRENGAYIYMSSYVGLLDRYPMSHVRLARRSDERPTAGDLVKTLRPSYLKSLTTCNNHYQAINSPLLTMNNLTYWTIMWISLDYPVLIYQLGNSIRSSDLPIFVMFIPFRSLHSPRDFLISIPPTLFISFGHLPNRLDIATNLQHPLFQLHPCRARIIHPFVHPNHWAVFNASSPAKALATWDDWNHVVVNWGRLNC